MKKQHTENIVRYSAEHLPVDTKTHWKRVDAMTNKKIEANARSDADSLLVDDAFWEAAQLVMPSHVNKERITMRIDAEVLDWLKNKGHGYQSRINSILRSFMQTERARHKNKLTRRKSG